MNLRLNCYRLCPYGTWPHHLCYQQILLRVITNPSEGYRQIKLTLTQQLPLVGPSRPQPQSSLHLGPTHVADLSKEKFLGDIFNTSKLAICEFFRGLKFQNIYNHTVIGLASKNIYIFTRLSKIRVYIMIFLSFFIQITSSLQIYIAPDPDKFWCFSPFCAPTHRMT